jgi:Cu2+-exporting ATPase
LSPPISPSAADPAGPPAPPVSRCPHCGTAVEGAGDVFCCLGCAHAAAIIRGAGLERYYAEREAYPPRPEPAEGGWAAVPTETGADGSLTARLMVDGLRCASCVWVTEKVLEATDGVRSAVVSYASGRATLRWDPARTDLAALARRIAALGYRPRPLDAAPTTDRDLLARLGIAAVAAVAVMGLYEGLYAGWWYGGMDPRFAALFRWTSLLIATPVALWCATPFYAGAAAGLRRRVLHMDLPVALGIGTLYLHGLAMTLLGRDAYLDSLTMLVALLLGGRVLESRGRRRAAEAATALAASVPRTARRAVGEALETVAVDQLRTGDLVDAGAGEEIAADGVITEGSGQVRMALLTGESEPILLGPGARVVAGAILLDGALTVRVEAVGPDTLVQRMAGSLETAGDARLRPTAADRLAPWFTAAILLTAAATFAAVLALVSLEEAVGRTVAVLVVACPCALALAQPLAAAAGLGAAARRGVLLRSTDAFLALNDVTLVALDKTGTVTAGDVAVTGADPATLRVAAGLERYSAHPIARAIVAEAARRGIPLPRGSEVRELGGVGITGVVDGRRWRLESGGPGLVRLTDDHGAASAIRLGDVTRSDAADTVAALRALGHRVVLLTGDHPDVAHRVAAAAGIDEVLAGADPEAKSAAIRRFRSEGQRILFAGDGLNDGPALAAADVGLAMGRGSASSVLVADGIVSGETLGPVVSAFRAARVAGRVARFNHVQSLVYNLASVAAAVAGLVTPLVAAILMPISSAVVIWTSLRVEPAVRRLER